METIKNILDQPADSPLGIAILGGIFWVALMVTIYIFDKTKDD